jgi:ATP-dependent protease ClpP protease subunit
MPKKINIKGPIVTNDYADIYQWLGWDAAWPKLISEGLEEAAGDDVVIEINSPGGICVAGYEMYTAIMAYEGKVTAHVISAMSAATLLVCAANEALISDTGIFMIHNTQSSARGDYRDMEMEASALKEFNAGIINAYVRKTGKTREEIQALMDKDTYMSPQTAIELGFIDGYMFKQPESKQDTPQNFATQIVAANVPIIPEDKAKMLRQMIAEAEQAGTEDVSTGPIRAQVAPVQPQTMQKTGVEAVSDIPPKEGGRTNMTLTEVLAEHPEVQAEIDAAKETARVEGKDEGVKEERKRIQSLDNIAKTVSAEALTDAKYGENPVDGPTLAYQAMMDGNKLAAAYMKNAQTDSEESGAPDVGAGKPDAGEPEDNEADEMAGYVNSQRGGK